MTYEELIVKYKKLLKNIKGGNEEFYQCVSMHPDDLVKMINYIEEYEDLTDVDVLIEELRLKDERYYMNEDYLKVTLEGLKEINNHIDEYRKFDMNVFNCFLENENKKWLIKLFEFLFYQGYFESSLSEDELFNIKVYEYNMFYVWINSMYLTPKGYEYLEELKQKFKD